MEASKPHFAVRLLPSLTDAAFLMPIVFLFLRMGGATGMLGDGDTGWHVRTGEWIMANGRVPHEDMFSYTQRRAAVVCVGMALGRHVRVAASARGHGGGDPRQHRW